MSFSRADKGGFANWWFTVDKVALTGMGLLLGIGLMLAFAASPTITGGPLGGRFSLCRAAIDVCSGGILWRALLPRRGILARLCHRLIGSFWFCFWK